MTDPLRKDETPTTIGIASDRHPSHGPKLVEKEAGLAREEGDGTVQSQHCMDQPPSLLFRDDEARMMREKWDKIQTSFVDEPREAVEQADSLVATVIRIVAEQFAQERAQLEGQWDRGDNVSTENLRLALKKYRTFFDRLLSA
jgi:hypothetical protein